MVNEVLGSTTTGARLRQLREEKGMSQGQLANEMNLHYDLSLNASRISKWENGTKMNVNTLKKFAAFFNVTLQYLSGRFNIADLEVNYIPRLRSALVNLSNPFDAENIVDLDWPIRESGVDFTLRCPDNAMIVSRINEGELVYAEKTDTAQPGELIVCVYDGVLLVRRYFLIDGKIVLRAENPLFPSIEITEERRANFQVIGRINYSLAVHKLV